MFENFACFFDLVDHPWQADGQGICIVHPIVGDVARLAEGAVEANGKPRILVVKTPLQHESVHDREYARLLIISPLDGARIAEQAPHRCAERFGDHDGSKHVDLAVFEHVLERPVRRHELDAQALRRLDGADRASNHPGHVLGRNVVFVQ